jgi:PAS domain S-box-containing protein
MAEDTNKYSYDSSYIDALFASIGVGIVATDSNGDIHFINDAALDMFNYDRDAVMHERFTDKIVPVHEDGTFIDVMDRPIAQAFMTGQPTTKRIMYKRSDGSIVPALVTISPIKLHGKPTGAIAAFRDISQEIESDRMKSDFISLASHQLRTPLSSINIYAHLLHSGKVGELNAQQKLFIHTILSSAKRMNELINTLLNITRIEAGDISIDIHRVQLDKLVKDVLNEIKPSVAEKDLTLRHSIEHRLAPISTDDLLVREVCVNFLTNAIKYTPSGGHISVTLKSTKYNIVFSVSDTGYGIPKAAQKRIFSKFFRASNILSQDATGTGLGLYLTKMIAEKLDGDVWFESVENKGTTFYFSLPKRGSVARSSNFTLEV